MGDRTNVLRRIAKQYARPPVGIRLSAGQMSTFGEALGRSFLVTGWGHFALLVELPKRWAKPDPADPATIDLHPRFFGGAAVSFRRTWQGETVDEYADLDEAADRLASARNWFGRSVITAVLEDGTTRPLTAGERTRLAKAWALIVSPETAQVRRG